jgi:hypothetical protein
VADLLGMERHGMTLKMAGPKGRDVVYGGIVLPPGPADPSSASAILAASDRRDARPRAEVAAEVTERLTRMPPESSRATGERRKAKVVARVQQLPSGE